MDAATITALMGAAGGLIGTVGGAIAMVYTAKKKAKDEIKDERLTSIETALKQERDTVQRLRNRIDILEQDRENNLKLINALEDKIDDLRENIYKKEEEIIGLKSKLSEKT